MISRPENIKELFDLFFSFSLPKVQTALSLAIELAKRTRFLRDEVIAVEMEEKGQIIDFYEALKKISYRKLNRKTICRFLRSNHYLRSFRRANQSPDRSG